MLATGGGAVLAEENRRRLQKRGIVVYLQAPLDMLMKRTRHDRHRPLLQTGDRRRALEDIITVREPLYRETADIVVETSDARPHDRGARDCPETERTVAARTDA